MMKFYKYSFVGAAFLVALTGCIDNKYDLSDIDTTSEFKINDLVLPVNIEPITLSDIITVKDDGQIKEVTLNGKTFFAVRETGTFESDNIEVNKFSADAKPMNPNKATFELGSDSQSKPGRKASGLKKTYNIADEVYEPLEYSASDVDPSVRSLSYLYFTATDGKDLKFIITVNTQSLGSSVNSYLQNLTFQIPEGLNVTNVEANGYVFNPNNYDQAKGVLKVEKVNVVNNEAKITIYSDAIDLSSYDNPLVYNPSKDVSEFDLTSEFSIKKGCQLIVEGSESALMAIPASLDFDVNYSVGSLLANAIIGEIEYNLEGTGLQLDPINIDNLPDFLADSETNLVLANPQIYLNMDNPVGGYGLGYQSGLNIIATREDQETKNYPLGSEITVAGKAGSYNFLLAPDPAKVEDRLPEYSQNLETITYTGLGNILSGAGLPNSLDIELIDPMIPLQKTTSKFELGVSIDGMKGSYEFLAPLALTGESKIVYTKTEDGWWSEDLADLMISKLQISTTATSTVPLDATVAIYPLDKDGNRISGLDIQPLKLPAQAQDYPLTFMITGEITNLDGVFITATVRPDGNDEVLTPAQSITMKDIKAKVSGNYIKKF